MAYFEPSVGAIHLKLVFVVPDVKLMKAVIACQRNARGLGFGTRVWGWGHSPPMASIRSLNECSSKSSLSQTAHPPPPSIFHFRPPSTPHAGAPSWRLLYWKQT